MNPTDKTYDFSSWRWTAVFILAAYAFSFAMRLIWVYTFKDNPAFHWNGQLMINTNDGYYFASAVQVLLDGAHSGNPLASSALHSYPGMVYISYLLAKFTPMSLETTILYLPAIISGLIVIPLVMMGRLLKAPIVGFASALLGSIVWSYYNRTMIGYYDTDMFSVFFLYVIVYLFLLTIYRRKITDVLWLSGALLIYPFLYKEGMTLAYAVFALWVIYKLVFQRDDRNIYLSIIVLSIAFWNVTVWAKAFLIIVAYYGLMKTKNRLTQKQLVYMVAIALIAFVGLSDILGIIISQLHKYLGRGVETHGLHFYQVIQTVREAGHIPWTTVANRISGHPVAFAASAVGYMVLLFRHRAFAITLPLVGVGLLAHKAGLRFTVYAVPMAAMSAVYLFWVIGEYLGSKKAQYGLVVAATLALLYPNYLHIKAYRVPTVFNKSEVSDLEKLNKISKSKDYTLTWWDYGYPIWFYGDTTTLIDGGKHNDDNFIVSTIMQTDSPALAARLSRLAVETYAGELESYKKYLASGKKEDTIPREYRFVDKDAQPYHTADLPAADVIFRNGQPDQKDPNIFLQKLSKGLIKLPSKTRDVYIGMPFRMMDIFPTVMIFGNIDLTTGNKKRDAIFIPTVATKADSKIVLFANGMVFDAQKGILRIGNQQRKIRDFILTKNTYDDRVQIKKQTYNFDGDLSIIFMSSYKRFVIVDNQTLKSMYIQMFMLGKYDPKYFEPVVTSPYSRVYKLKI